MVRRQANLSFVVAIAIASIRCAVAAEPLSSESPADHLPPYITHATSFGERADWSHDGKRILFLSKTFGDAMELDVASGAIRNLTAHYPHHGYTRALYLANGDVLLSGPESFDVTKPGEARNQCMLYVLDQSLTKPPVPLGVRCIEGPAVSRKRLHIAWTDWPEQSTGDSATDDSTVANSQIDEADIVYENGRPNLASRRRVLASSDLTFPCSLESQNFRPPAERELIFSAYRPSDGADVCGVDLVTKQVTNYTSSPAEYDESEGIFPDGTFTLVECDRQNDQGPNHVDIWKLALNPNGDVGNRYERLTQFSDYPGYKSSNPVVSDDGRYIAFQMAHSADAAGVGHGIFIYDTQKAAGGER
jgi:Tol biopolymer transport system component